MDPKASAKSKRSYSQHGRRAHHHPPPPSSSSHKKKTTVDDPQQQQQQQRARPPKPSLPSNWDRYELEEDENRHTITSAAATGPKPKSEGADFSYLLEQARNAARSPPSFDDAVPDFIRGLSPFALQRGKKLLLSCGVDDFVVDDQVTSSLEVPFLSLDLDALASQLEKLKLSQRLFIDAEYLQEELDTKEPRESPNVEVDHEESPEHLERNSSVASGHIIEEAKSAETKFFTHVTDKYFVAPEMTAGAGLTKAASSVESESRSVLNITQDRILSEESAGSVMDSSRVFEASTAEAELDMLLDSLSEINLPSSSATEKLSYDPPSLGGGYNSSASLGFSRLSQDINSSSLSVPASEHAVRRNPNLGSKSPNSYSKGSRFGSGDGAPTGHDAPTSFLNDKVDDLLVQASAITSHHQNSSSKQEVGKQTVNISQALDDLDSLLDGL